MSKDSVLQRIKSFGMTNNMIISDLKRVESDYSINLGFENGTNSVVEEQYYPQFSAIIRDDAKKMSRHYELFYCLEKSIRSFISKSLESVENSEEWWNTDRIPQQVKAEVNTRIQKEIDSGISRRSLDELDYTNFGELTIIINTNWDVFGGIFTSKKAVERVMASLNTLRAPIAHCSLLAEDEIIRLNLAVRDWFRLME